LASKNAIVIPHPPYSPDLAACDFPTPKDETEAHGVTFWKQWKDPDQIYFKQCFPSWESHLDCCINAEGNYFQGDGGE